MPESPENLPNLSQCHLCLNYFRPQGFPSHQRSCQKKSDDSEHDARNSEDLQDNDSTVPAIPTGGCQPAQRAKLRPWMKPELRASSQRDIPNASSGPSEPAAARLNVNQGQTGAAPAPQRCPSPDLNDANNPPLNFIKTEFHPHSARKTTFQSLADYLHAIHKSSVPPTSSYPPYRPFKSQLDFDFAELALQAHLNHDQIDRFISIIQRCQGSKADERCQGSKADERLSFKSYKDFQTSWDDASSLLTPFEKVVINPVHNTISECFDFYHRSLWDWAMDLVKDPTLAPHFEWDAKRMYKSNGEQYVRFVSEPCTGDRLWELQSLLPLEGKVLSFIVYADKTQLSSFGGKLGHPVFARLGNLPSHIRNSQDYGGGRLVGWLPIVEDDEDEKGKTDYVNFKRVVWHESFRHLFSTIKAHARTGCWTECGDTLLRLLFPIIVILSADYEEQVVMALIRGSNGDYPCPVCLVPRAEQANFKKTWPRRNLRDSEKTVRKAREMTTKARAEELLKSFSLRDVDSAFLDIGFSDPYDALSFDRMHNYPHGLGGKHLWPALQSYIEDLGRDACKSMDTNASEFPRWRNLNHFKKIFDVKFSDATKLEDILKLAVFVTHPLFSPASHHPEAYLLLRCVRAYTIVDSYLKMSLHTEFTIAKGRDELKIFLDLITTYIRKTKDTISKLWQFPKIHLHTHAFDDILAKGASLGFDSMINEPLHGPLKDSYLLRTNFKDVDPQILRVDHWSYVAMFIRNLVELSAAALANPEPINPDGRDGSNPTVEELVPTGNGIKHQFEHVTLGARQKSQTITSLLSNMANNPSFHNFAEELNIFVELEIDQGTQGVPKISRHAKITEFRFIKCAYESLVTWQTETDYLRCNPCFNHAPRYDSAIFHTPNGFMFGQFILVFTLTVNKIDYPIALIQPFQQVSQKSPSIKKKDTDLRLLRLQKTPHQQFILLTSLIRGALITSALDNDEQYLVFDLTDSDMTMRIQKIVQK